MNSRKQLKLTQDQRISVAESSADVQTPVANEAELEAGTALYKVTTLNGDAEAVVQRTDAVGHISSVGGGGSGNTERLQEVHTHASVDV